MLAIPLKQKKSVVSFITIMVLLLTSPLFANPPFYNAQYSVFSRDGSQLIYVNSLGNEIIKIQVKTEKIIKRTPLKLGAGSQLLAPTPDGFKLLAVHAKGIDVIHNGTGKILRTLPHPSGHYDWRGMISQQNNSGTLLAIPSLRNTKAKIYLIHTGSGKIIRSIPLAQRGKIGSIAFNSNNRLLAYTQLNNRKSTLYLYDINQQKQLINLAIKGATNAYQEKLYFDRNNKKLLLSGIKQKTVKLIDIDKQVVIELNYPYSNFANFSADGKNLVILQAQKNTLIIRNLATGKQQVNKLSNNQSDIFPIIIQNPSKTLLALPKKMTKGEKIYSFLWINGQTGKVLH